jgi:hypothetical protein
MCGRGMLRIKYDLIGNSTVFEPRVESQIGRPILGAFYPAG